ncbi:MAG: DUF2510 domain-containing protein [Aeromicrobium sp.]
MTEHENATPAGWYDDGTGRQRWFDGTAWGDYAEQTTAVAPVADDGPVVVRRTRRAPFVPPDRADPPDSTTTVSRDWGLGLRSSKVKKDVGLTRNREIAGDLPSWSPLPPGELSVDRSSGRRP